MPELPPIPISRRAARRFLIEVLGLRDGPLYAATPPAPAQRVLQEIRRLECVQLDPVAAVERNQHLVLAARVPGYAPAALEQLLAGRRVFEYWANAACVIPMEDYWTFEGERRRRRRRLRRERALLRKPAAFVLRELQRSGPLPSRAFTTGERIAGYWDEGRPKTKATTHALNVLWDTGEVVVVRRDGAERYFDLPHRAVPAAVLRRAKETALGDADRALLEKYLRAYRIFDLGDFRFGWQNIPAARRRSLITRYMKAGRVVPLQIEGTRRPYFALAEDASRLRGYERGDEEGAGEGELRFLPPLDNLLWRRERLVDVFDFSYIWEAYTPPSKRRFGYYAMPILDGDRLIGRIDPRLDRARGRLTVHLVDLEPWVRPTTLLRRRLHKALLAFAGFHGASEVEVRRAHPAGARFPP